MPPLVVTLVESGNRDAKCSKCSGEVSGQLYFVTRLSQGMKTHGQVTTSVIQGERFKGQE